MRVGDRIELTANIEALGHKHQTGDTGTVQEIHTGGHLTARMDDGRTNFPHTNETKPAR